MESTNEGKTVSAAQAAKILGFTNGMIVQEFGWDEDVDEDLRDGVMDLTGEDLQDEDYTSMSDGTIIWWRDDDGSSDDLSDLLMDAFANLDEGGVIWVLSPVHGDNRVDPRLVEEACKTAGMKPTSTKLVSPDWSGTRIVYRNR